MVTDLLDSLLSPELLKMTDQFLCCFLVLLPSHALKLTVEEDEGFRGRHAVLRFTGTLLHIQHVMDDGRLLQAIPNQEEETHHTANLRGLLSTQNMILSGHTVSNLPGHDNYQDTPLKVYLCILQYQDTTTNTKTTELSKSI